MNDGNYTRALTVYIPPQEEQKKSRLLIFKSKISAFLIQAFNFRKREFVVFFALYIIFMFFGACASLFDFAISASIPYAFSTVGGKSGVLFLLTLIIFSGFTIYGKITSVIYDISIAFIVGSVLNNIFVVHYGDSFFALFSFLTIALISFFSIIIAVEVFYFSQNAFIGRRSLFSLRKCAFYFIVTYVFTFSIYFLLSFVLYY